MRAIKTGIAVMISIAIGNTLNLYSPSMAAFAAVISMQTNMFGTLEVSVFRMLSTLLGAVVALFFHALGYVNYATFALGTILLIAICNWLKWQKAIALSVIVFIIIMQYNVTTEPLGLIDYSLSRLYDTSVGLAVGFGINLLILPPKPQRYILETYDKTYTDALNLFETILTNREEVNTSPLLADITSLNARYAELRADRKLKLNVDVDTLSIEVINNKFLLLLSLLNDITDTSVRPALTEQNTKALREVFGKTLVQEVEEVKSDDLPVDDDYTIVYNYDISKVIRLLLELQTNIARLHIAYGHRYKRLH